MTFTDGDERYSSITCSRARRKICAGARVRTARIAEFCFGLMGRTPDAIAGNITGLSDEEWSV